MAVDPVSLAITVALNAASMAMTASKKIEGPRLDDLKASTADYGTPMVQIYGTSRVECFCMYVENLREVHHRNKTKGGKYDEYKYFGTWGSFIADCPTGPIDGVLKIWLDRHLVYQNVDPGAVHVLASQIAQFADEQQEAAEAVGGAIRIYTGTEDQNPDPRLLVKIGADECPAYRGIAYAIFEEIPLEPFGNRLPQVSMLPTRSKLPSYPWQYTPGGSTFDGIQVSPELQRVYNISGTRITIWDAPSRTLITDQTIPGMAIDFYAIVPGDGIYGINNTGEALFYISLDGGGVAEVDLHPPGWVGIFYAGGALYLAPGSFTGMYAGIAAGSGVAISVSNYYPSWYFTNIDGDAISVGTDDAFGATQHFFIGPALGVGTEVDTSAYGSYGPCRGFDNGTEYVVRQLDWVYRIDKSDYHIIQAANFSGGVHFIDASWLQIRPGAKDWWEDGNHYSATDLSLIESVNISLWVGSARTSELPGTLYEPTTNALISGNTFGDVGITWRFLRLGGGGWTLGAICEDVAIQVGMDPLRYDFSDLDQNVPGYAWTQGAGKDIIGALLDLHDSDIRPHGFIQQGLKRGKPYSAGPIFSEWMVNESRGEDAASQPLYSLPMASETDLPLRVTASFADPNMEDQPNTVHAQRNQASVQTYREQTFDLTTLRELPDTIQGLIERALRRYWVGSLKPAFLVTPLEIRLEPADVRPIVLEDGSVMRCRATKTVIRANRVIQTEWELDGETQVNPPAWDHDDANPLNAVYATPPALGEGRPPDTVYVPGRTKGFVFDTPLLTDADDQTAPFLYDAAGLYVDTAPWAGAMVFSADALAPDTIFDGGWDGFGSSEASIWGLASTTLPDAVTDVMDEASVLKVNIIGGGSLTSVTTAQLLADQSLNLALIGGELIQFRDADEVDTNSYELTGLIRGARNSEYAATGHAVGEKFLLIGANRHKRTMGASEIGDTDYYKFSSTSDDLDSAEVLTVPFNANAHRPPAPAHLALHLETSGNWTVSWTRRSRIGGGAVDGQDVPLGETFEQYHVKIMSGGSVLATYTTTTSSFTYTVAEQTADWGSAQTGLTVEVCQMSPALSLEGFSSTASA